MREVRVGDRVAVRVVGRVAERLVDVRFQLLGERVLEPVGLRMNRVERQTERLREVLLEQPVMADDLERRPLPLLRQRRALVRLVLDEARARRAS